MGQGPIVGHFDQNNNIEDFYSVGKISASKSAAPTKKHIYEIGSISKVFTGIVLASLVTQGEVKLTDPVSSILPQLKNYPAGKIKLVQLSTHMSGLPRLPSNMGNVDLSDPYAKYDAKKLYEYLKSVKKINFPTTIDFKNYSNLAVGLLGHLLEIKTGLSYEQLVKMYITVPLGMNDTSVVVPSNKQKLFVPGHNELLEHVPYWNLSSLKGAGALKSSAQDMMTFLKANAYPEKTTISRALKLAQTTQVQGEHASIGLGWIISDFNGHKVIEHNGGTGGFVSKLVVIPELEKGYLYLHNATFDLQCMGDILLRNKKCEPKFGIKISQDLLDSYAGHYVHTDSPFKINLITKFGNLYYEIPGQEKGMMQALDEKKFSIKGIATVVFDQQGGFVFTQNGASSKFIKQ